MTTYLPNIGLLGAKRSGKNTAASYLRDTYGYVEMGFADPMREIMEKLNPIVDWAADYSAIRYNDALDLVGYDDAKEVFPEVRTLLQRLGTDAGQVVFGKDFWVEQWARRYDRLMAAAYPKMPRVVLTDVRFPHEVKELRRRRDFVLVKLTGRGVGGDAHASETALAGFEPDVTIDNSGTLDELYGQVSLALLTAAA